MFRGIVKNSERGKWNEENDEFRQIDLYRERLEEVEIAFRYNLNLLSDRDAELDAMEEQLRNGIAQIERIAEEKADRERIAKRFEEEVRELRRTLKSRDEAIQALERKHSEMRKARREERMKFVGIMEKEKTRLEEDFARAIRSRESSHSEEVNRLIAKLNDMAKERENLNATLKRMLRKANYRTDEKETITEPRGKFVATQTDPDDRDEERQLLREQNQVLKNVIKNLKRNGEKPADCDCLGVKEKIEETNRKFDSEIADLKKIVEREKRERCNEEAIIQNLETSVVSLKEKLMSGLWRNLDPEDFPNEFQLMEDRLSRKLDGIMSAMAEMKTREKFRRDDRKRVNG